MGAIDDLSGRRVSETDVCASGAGVLPHPIEIMMSRDAASIANRGFIDVTKWFSLNISGIVLGWSGNRMHVTVQQMVNAS